MSELDNKSLLDNQLSVVSDSEEDIEFMKQVALFDSTSSKATGDRSSSPSDACDTYAEGNQYKKPLNINEFENSSKYLTKSSNNSPNPKKIGRKILGELKTKRPCNIKPVNIQNKIEKKTESPEKKVRVDNFGTVINKKNKRKVKVVFKTPFKDVQYIESFKKYNLVNGLPKTDTLIPQFENCKCQTCQIW